MDSAQPERVMKMEKLERKLPRKKLNLLQKLYIRETRGTCYTKEYRKKQQLFPHIPQRLMFNLTDVVPESALAAGHVFMGFSNCGQFLISYTFVTDSDHISDVYLYRLHWWLFVPQQQARKVAEVNLFNDLGVHSHLYILICQWPKDSSRILVYGCGEDQGSSQPHHCYITITAVPSVHNCKECQIVAASYGEEDLAASWDSCVRFSCMKHGLTIHTSFDIVPPYPLFEPEFSMKVEGTVVVNTGNFLHVVAANLEHLPTGGDCQRMLHHSQQSQQSVTTRESSPLQSEDGDDSIASGNLCFCPRRRGTNSTVSGDAFEELLQTRKRFEVSSFLAAPRAGLLLTSNTSSPLQCCPLPEELKEEWGDMPLSTTTIASSECSESDDSLSFPESPYGDKSKSPASNSVASPRSAFRGVEISSPLVRKEMKMSPLAMDCRTPNSRNRLAEKAYEFTDESPDISSCEKLSTFRKRRLADRKYEFSDEDAENVVPFWLLRKHARADGGESSEPGLVTITNQSGQEGTANGNATTAIEHGEELTVTVAERSPRGSGCTLVCPPTPSPPVSSVENQVLRPRNCNWASPLYFPQSPTKELIPDQKNLSPKEYIAHLPMSLSVTAGDVIDDQPWMHASTRCVVEFIRRYVEVDDELITVITDIEEDDLSGNTGFHTALPLEVHGSGYSQMQMISSTTAEKLAVPCVVVRQMSFDVEQFCHEMAQKLCAEAGKKYWFCSDYDVEVVDVCPDSEMVIAVAVMLVEAAPDMTVVGKSQRFPTCSRQRKRYQTGFKFSWSLETGCHRVLDTDIMREFESVSKWRERWHPAKAISNQLRRERVLRNAGAAIRSFSNIAELQESSQKAIVDLDNMVALIAELPL